MFFTKFYCSMENLSYARGSEFKNGNIRVSDVNDEQGNQKVIKLISQIQSDKLCNNMGLYKFQGKYGIGNILPSPWARVKMVSSSLYHSPPTFPNNTPSRASRCCSAYHCGVCEKPKTPRHHMESTKRD